MEPASPSVFGVVVCKDKVSSAYALVIRSGSQVSSKRLAITNEEKS